MKVKIRSWKKIKSITRKDKIGNRHYKDHSVFFDSRMKNLCGKKIKIKHTVVHTWTKGTEFEWIIEPWMCKGGKF